MSKKSTVKTVNPIIRHRDGDTLMEKIIHRVKNGNANKTTRNKKQNEKMPPSRRDQQQQQKTITTTTTQQIPLQTAQQQVTGDSAGVNEITHKNEVQRNFLVENNFMYIDDDDDDEDDDEENDVDNDIQGNLHNKDVNVNKPHKNLMETNNNNDHKNINKNVVKNDEDVKKGKTKTNEIITEKNNNDKNMMMITGNNNVTMRNGNVVSSSGCTSSSSSSSNNSKSINNLLNGRKLKQQISLCITEDSECDRQLQENHQHQCLAKHTNNNNNVDDYDKVEQQRVHDDVYDKLKNKQPSSNRRPTKMMVAAEDHHHDVVNNVGEGQGQTTNKNGYGKGM